MEATLITPNHTRKFGKRERKFSFESTGIWFENDLMPVKRIVVEEDSENDDSPYYFKQDPYMKQQGPVPLASKYAS